MSTPVFRGDYQGTGGGSVLAVKFTLSMMVMVYRGAFRRVNQICDRYTFASYEKAPSVGSTRGYKMSLSIFSNNSTWPEVLVLPLECMHGGCVNIGLYRLLSYLKKGITHRLWIIC